MQKFGLQRTSSNRHSTIELEIAKEQASSLGRAGKKLRLSLENYQQNLHKPNQSNLIHEISSNLWELIIQRELTGFVEGNLDWIRQNYHIPDAAIKLIGEKK